MTDREAFFDAVFGNTIHDVEFRAMSPEKKQVMDRLFIKWPDMASIEEFIHKNINHDVYFGVGTRAGEKGTKEAVKEIPSLWMDSDFKDLEGGEADANKILSEINGLFPPSIIVQSGNGYHLYWLLKEPEEARPEVEAYLNGLANSFQGDRSSAELARILRVPGTLNSKYDPKREVTIIKLDSDVRYNLSDFDIFKIEKTGLEQKKRFDTAGVLEGVPEGQRDVKVYGLACKFRSADIPKPIAERLILEAARNCQPSFPESEALEKVARAYEHYPAGHVNTPNSILSPKIRGQKETNFAPVGAAKLLSHVEQELRWIWDKWIATGILFLIIAFMKVGKSELIYRAAVKIAQGRPFLGFITSKTAVLILGVEEHPRDARRRLVRLGMTLDDPIFAHLGPLKNNPETLKEIREFIIKNNIGLVLIDTLSRFWNLVDENNNAEIVREISPLLDLARETGAAIGLIHHERKSGGEAGRNIRGGSSLFGLVDQAILLDKRPGGSDTQRVLKTFGRYADSPKELIIDLVEGEYIAVGTSSEAQKMADRDTLLEIIGHEPTTIKELAADAGLKQKKAWEMLTEMAREDIVIQEGKGIKGDPLTFKLRSRVIQEDGKGNVMTFNKDRHSFLSKGYSIGKETNIELNNSQKTLNEMTPKEMEDTLKFEFGPGTRIVSTTVKNRWT